MNPRELIEPIRQLADRMEAYAEARESTVKRCITESGLIGANGGLIEAYNDKSQPAEIRSSIRLAAGTLGAVYAGKVSPAVAAKRLRIEANAIEASEGQDSLKVACSMRTAGSTWRDITVFVDGRLYSEDKEAIQKQIDACTRRVKTYATTQRIRLPKGNPGRKPGKT
jgi:hypothetical protein